MIWRLDILSTRYGPSERCRAGFPHSCNAWADCIVWDHFRNVIGPYCLDHAKEAHKAEESRLRDAWDTVAGTKGSAGATLAELPECPIGPEGHGEDPP